MIRQCLDITNVIPTNEDTKYVKCGLLVSFSKFWLLLFCFMTKKGCFNLKLLHCYCILLKVLVIFVKAFDFLVMCKLL